MVLIPGMSNSEGWSRTNLTIAKTNSKLSYARGTGHVLELLARTIGVDGGGNWPIMMSGGANRGQLSWSPRPRRRRRWSRRRSNWCCSYVGKIHTFMYLNSQSSIYAKNEKWQMGALINMCTIIWTLLSQARSSCDECHGQRTTDRQALQRCVLRNVRTLFL